LKPGERTVDTDKEVKLMLEIKRILFPIDLTENELRLA